MILRLFKVLLVAGGLLLVASIHSSPRASTSIRPVAEFEPVQSLLLSEHILGDNTNARSLLRTLHQTGLRTILMVDGARTGDNADFLTPYGLTEAESKSFDLISVAHDSFWVRDFGPLPLAMTLNNRHAFVYGDFTFRTEEDLNDSVPYQIAIYTQKSVIHVPLMNDGGNFLTDGENCFLTQTFGSAPSPLAAGATSLGEQEASLANEDGIKILRESVGCKKVIVFDTFAHEHIDMWAKFVDTDTVLVNELADEQVHNDEAREMKSHLDEAARIFSNEGYRVIRMPMPSVPEGDQFQTYLNALILNDQVLVPSFRHEEPQATLSTNPNLDRKLKQSAQNKSRDEESDQNLESPTRAEARTEDPDAEESSESEDLYYTGEPIDPDEEDRLSRLEEQVREIYKSQGLEVHWVNGNYLARSGGSFHCILIALPSESRVDQGFEPFRARSKSQQSDQ